MNYIIGCDAHKHYSQFAVYEGCSLRGKQVRVEHERGAIREFLSEFPEGTPVALESIGNWYWIVDEMEQAGCQPLLAHPAKAKAMMGNVNQRDKLDARGLATLLRNGTLPTVWIVPSEMRDEREFPRSRMALCKIRVALKNRVHATLAKYNLSLPTDCANHYLKWAFVEAANGPAQYCKKPHWQHRHVTHLYERVKLRKGHSVAVGAVARHLAEAIFWILNKKEPYREPTRQKVLPKQA